MFIKYEHSSDPNIFLISDEIGRFVGEIYNGDLYDLIDDPAFTEEEESFYSVDKTQLYQNLIK